MAEPSFPRSVSLGCAHGQVRGQPSPVAGLLCLSREFNLWGQRGPPADLLGKVRTHQREKGVYAAQQSHEGFVWSHSLILCYKLALNYVGLLFGVRGFVMRTNPAY